MDSIPDMDETRPLVSVSAGFGNQWLQEIQRALKTQFASIGTSVVTATAENLNGMTGYDATDGTVEDRLSALEEKTNIAALPVEAYDFEDPWWGTPAADDPHRVYSGQMPSTSLSNTPWPWGTNDPGGRTYTLVVQRFVNNGVKCALNIVWRLSSNDDFAELFYRQATSSTELISAEWFRATFAQLDSAEGTSGDIVFSSACPEIAATCPP